MSFQPSKLEAFLLERQDMPFEWGKNDCCLFVADAVKAMCGYDYAASLRGYTTRFGAARRLYAAGGLSALIDSILSAVNPNLARRGDVVLFSAQAGDALGICLGRQFAAAGPDGVRFFGLEHAKRAWRCPQQ